MRLQNKNKCFKYNIIKFVVNSLFLIVIISTIRCFVDLVYFFLVFFSSLLIFNIELFFISISLELKKALKSYICLISSNKEHFFQKLNFSDYYIRFQYIIAITIAFYIKSNLI